MKPRFSILTLLGITLWAAVTLAAWTDPLSEWPFAVLCTWCVILVTIATVAAQSVSSQTVFARGMLFATFVYGMATWAEEEWLTREHRLPHFSLGELVSGATPPIPAVSRPLSIFDEFPWGTGESLLVAFCNVSLAFGLLGGCLALWRYRVLERREQQEKSG